MRNIYLQIYSWNYDNIKSMQSIILLMKLITKWDMQLILKCKTTKNNKTTKDFDINL